MELSDAEREWLEAKCDDWDMYKFDGAQKRLCKDSSHKHANTWWFTADLHFGHANIIKHCNRPFRNVEEMDEVLINNWNRVVHGGDVVVVAGDFTLHHDPEAVRYLYIRHLNGNIIFVKGNHDHWLRGADKRYMYIKRVDGQMIHVSHYPLRTWAGQNRQRTWQLHGHSHGMLEPYPNQWDVGVDANGYYPVSITQLRDLIAQNDTAGEGRRLAPDESGSYIRVGRSGNGENQLAPAYA